MFWQSIKTVLLGIVLLYFQVLIAPNLQVMGVIPNFLIGYIVFAGMQLTLIPALSISLLLGICYDLTMPLTLGLNTFSFLLLALLVSSVHQHIDKERMWSSVVSIVIVNLVYFFIALLTQLIASGFGANLIPLALVSFILNSIISYITVLVLIVIVRMKLDFHAE